MNREKRIPEPRNIGKDSDYTLHVSSGGDVSWKKVPSEPNVYKYVNSTSHRAVVDDILCVKSGATIIAPQKVRDMDKFEVWDYAGQSEQIPIKVYFPDNNFNVNDKFYNEFVIDSKMKKVTFIYMSSLKCWFAMM